MGKVNRLSCTVDDGIRDRWLATVEHVRTTHRVPISESIILRFLVEEFIRAAAEHPMGRLFPSFRIVPAGDDAALAAAEPPASPVSPAALPAVHESAKLLHQDGKSARRRLDRPR